MNERHLQLCASAEWAETVQREILPWALNGRNLGDDVLEVGPGPGMTTDVLRRGVARLTAVEVDAHLAAALAQRLGGSNVDVVHADGTSLPFEDGRFSGATSFTMLQGGLLIGVDSIDGPEWRELHTGDICVPVDPAKLGERLQQAGFVDVEVQRATLEPARRFRFSAHAPAAD